MLSIGLETNTNFTFHDEIHFCNFIFFIVDQASVALWMKDARSQVERHVIKELRVSIFPSLKEILEVVEDIIVQELNHDVFLQ